MRSETGSPLPDVTGAARELGHNEPFSTLPEDWAWWLRNARSQAAADSVGLPPLPASKGPPATA